MIFLSFGNFEKVLISKKNLDFIEHLQFWENLWGVSEKNSMNEEALYESSMQKLGWRFTARLPWTRWRRLCSTNFPSGNLVDGSLLVVMFFFSKSNTDAMGKLGSTWNFPRSLGSRFGFFSSYLFERQCWLSSSNRPPKSFSLGLGQTHDHSTSLSRGNQVEDHRTLP